MLCCFLPDSLQAPPASAPTLGAIRRGVRAPRPVRGDLVTGREFLAVFLEDEGRKPVVDSMDQSAEPSSMIGEFARVGGRRRTFPNKVLEDSLVNNNGRKQISKVLDVDDPIFGSRQLPKSRSINPFHNQNSNIRLEEEYFKLKKQNEETSQKTKFGETDLVFNEENDEHDLKHNLLFQIQNYRQQLINKDNKNTSRDQPITQNIIALGESRSYSFSTNTQPTTKKDYLDANHITYNQDTLHPTRSGTEPPQTQENPEYVENNYTTIAPGELIDDGTDKSTLTTSALEEDDEKTVELIADLGKVISVRVSSSVASSNPNKYQTFKTDTTLPSTATETNNYSTPSPLTLLTEDQPRVTAVQRSTFSVEEPTGQEFDPQRTPVSYHSSVSSATSGSSVRFYSDPPSYRRLVPKVEIPEQKTVSTTEAPKSAQQESSTKKQVELTTFNNFKVDPQYRHETRIEAVSFHEEVVPSQNGDQTFGRRVPNTEATRPLTTSYVSTPTSLLPESPVKITQDGDRTSYQFTNLQDQSYHHVHVTHLASKPDENRKEIEKRPRKPEDGRYFRYKPTTEKNYGVPERNFGRAEQVYGKPEENYEIDESVSVMTDGRAHGVQKPKTTTEATDKKKDGDNKFGYVVEGRNFRKYRVEERTPDGFIVGEYGVVSNDGGNLRGVRYTADGTINPRLIYDALVKFLSL